MISQALSSKLPSVINTVIGGNYVKTDMTIEEALGLAIKAASMQTDDIKYHMLEGEAKMINGASYWIHDPNKLEILLYKIYGFDLNEDGTVEETTDESSTESSTGN
jgi:anionic cell wall polymer biosynthesis LytR-Cps2A-Psr (LCP) family protein